MEEAVTAVRSWKLLKVFLWNWFSRPIDRKKFLFGRSDLRKLLPHGWFALRFIDSVTFYGDSQGKIRGELKIRWWKLIIIDLFGHFPAKKVVPGHVIDEFVCLTAAAMIPLSGALDGFPQVVGKDEIKYKLPAKIGDDIIATVKLENRRGNFVVFSAIVTNKNGETLVEYGKIKGMAVK